jgi:peptidoglycan/LPS O-acetylase OafA/YrhL
LINLFPGRSTTQVCREVADISTPILLVSDSTAKESHPRGWIPSLDGVRGLAVLMVLLYHCRFELTSNALPQRAAKWLFGFGWSGVDLFFVLSGFLITGILLESRNASNYFSSFYARRALRIFPLYYLSLIVAFNVAPRQHPETTRNLPPIHDRLWFFAYIQNWLGVPVVPWPHYMIHYWSLGVEEQFYLVWPLVIFMLPPRRVLQVIAGVCVFSLVLRSGLLAWQVDPSLIYRNTFARMDALLMGAACAFLVRDKKWTERLRGRTTSFSLAPLAVFIGLRPLQDVDWIDKSIGFTAVGLSYSALLLAVVLTTNQRSPLQTVFTNPLMMKIGKYSYAIYVWHLLVIQLVKKLELVAFKMILPGVLNVPLMIGATIAVSICSYAMVERPFLQLKRHFEAASTVETGR